MRARKAEFSRKDLVGLSGDLKREAGEIEAVAEEMARGRIGRIEVDGATIPESAVDRLRRFVANAKASLYEATHAKAKQ